jgi:hypothetical protein
LTYISNYHFFLSGTNYRYALGGNEDDWSEALATKGKNPGTGTVVSVKSGKDKKRKGESVKEVRDEYLQSEEKKKKKQRH